MAEAASAGAKAMCFHELFHGSYGTACFANPRGQFVDGAASDQTEELVVRDLDLDQIEEVRSQWAFYRDRRPDIYDSLTAP